MSGIATIAVNIMVKNAKDSIIRALKSIEREVDEIVVFDTGSSDGTQAAVQEHLAKLPSNLIKTFREVPWVDDFSAIRNQMLDATQSDWVFQLDADEVVTISERTLRDLTPSGHVAFYIEMRSYVKQKDRLVCALRGEFPKLEAGYVGYALEGNYRFFKRLPELRYSRIIHESIEPSLMRHGIRAVRVNHVLLHNYGRHDMSVKSQWNRALVEKMVRQTPDDALAWYYLGAHEQADGQYAQAIDCLSRCLAAIPDYSSAKILKAQCLAQLGRTDEAEKLLLDMIGAAPREEVAWIELLWLAADKPDAYNAVTHLMNRAVAGGCAGVALYETAAQVFTRLKKRVKADLYRKKASDLRRQRP